MAKNMDRKLYAASQKHEVRWVLKKFPAIPEDVVIKIAKQAGRSRVKLYQMLLEWTLKNLT